MRADTHDPPADKGILRPYYSNSKNLSTCLFFILDTQYAAYMLQ